MSRRSSNWAEKLDFNDDEESKSQVWARDSKKRLVRNDSKQRVSQRKQDEDVLFGNSQRHSQSQHQSKRQSVAAR